jgi:flagellar protein FliS
MRTPSAASAYKEALFENAPPLKIVHLLYEGALRFLAQAEALDPRAEPAQFGERLRRAGRIVSELRLSLDHGRAPELCADLSALYAFVERRIQDALLERTVAPVAEARAILEPLLAAWKALGPAERPAA